MGIPGFNTWFNENYARSYVPLSQVRVDHLYIDLNSVLHNVMRKARNHNHFHKMLHKRLHGILESTQPTKSVMIAVDGPAPLAKLLTQRERRKKSGRQLDDGDTLTGVAITPGTTFMLDLTHSLTYYVCVKLSGKRYRHLKFEISDGTVMGEGEVKVLGRLARPWHPDDPNDTHVILGDDADLILMALTSYKENLFVANSGLNEGRLDGRTPVFSVNLLHQAWASGLLSKVIAGGSPLESALLHAKLDLTLIAIMAKGNDYLPGGRGVGLDAGAGGGLWGVYQSAVKSGGAALAGVGGRGSITLIDLNTGAPRIDAVALARLLKLSGAGSGDNSRSTWLGSKAAADPHAYLRGCVWLLQMYLTGECPDYRFYYDGVAPSASALVHALEALAAAGHTSLSLDSFASFGHTPDPRASQPLLPAACALALLPANCSHLAAPCVRHLMDGSGSTAEDGTAATLDGGLYEDLYGDCDECQRISAENARVQRALQAAKARHTELSQQLEELLLGQRAAGAAAGNGGKSRGSGQRKNNRRDASAARSAALSAAAAAVVAAASSDSESEGDGDGGGAQTAAAAKAAEVLRLQQEAAAAEAEHARLKSELSAVDGRRMRHVELAHPYRRFPVEQLERAAEAAIAAAKVRPEELPATSFGVPFVVRAFNSRPEAATFIRSQPVHHHHHRKHHHHPHGHQHQQHRETHTQATAAPGSEYSLIFNPPPPPFVVQGTTYFAPLVRQSVLYDEYGSEVGVQLHVMRGQRAEEVRYLSAPEALEQQQRMVSSQQQRQEFAPVLGQQGQGRGQGEGMQPRGQAGGPPGRLEPQAQEQQQRTAAAAAAAATAAATAATAAAAAGAAASLPMPDALLQKLRGAAETQREEQRTRARAGETGGSLAASYSGPMQAERAPIVAEAAGGQGKGGGRRERKPGTKAVAAVAAAESDGATAVGVAVGVAVAVGEEGGAGAAGGAGAGVHEGEKRRRGRPKGSKNKPKAGQQAHGGAGDGESAAVQSAVASAVAAVGVSMSAVTAATAGLTLTHGSAPSSAGPPPMPSSRLLSNALRGAGGGGATGAPRAPYVQQPQPQQGTYQHLPTKAAGLPTYGHVGPAPQPPPYGGGAMPHYAAGGGRWAMQGTPYGGPPVVAAAQVGGFAAVRPAPYRPPSPPLALSAQQSAAAATAAQARGRPVGPIMGR